MPYYKIVFNQTFAAFSLIICLWIVLLFEIKVELKCIGFFVYSYCDEQLSILETNSHYIVRKTLQLTFQLWYSNGWFLKQLDYIVYLLNLLFKFWVMYIRQIASEGFKDRSWLSVFKVQLLNIDRSVPSWNQIHSGDRNCCQYRGPEIFKCLSLLAGIVVQEETVVCYRVELRMHGSFLVLKNSICHIINWN